MDSIGKRVCTQTEEKLFIPDEILMNILKRLSPKTIARFQLVCRGWKDLALARDFVDCIFKNTIPMILVTNPRSYSRLDLYVIDNWWEHKATIRRFPCYSGKFPNTSRALFSHAGLIVFQLNESRYDSSDTNFVIINPARPRHECVTITLAKRLWKSEIYGVYFHPLLEGYCSLWRIDASLFSGDYPGQGVYMILDLGSNSFLRTVNNPFGHRAKKWGVSPIFINDCLYWLLGSLQESPYSGHNDIMEFNIISEEFMIIPCPFPLDIQGTSYQTRLTNIDGILSFVVISSSKITIWRLDNHAERLWTVAEYAISINPSPTTEARSEIVIVDGKLGLLSKGMLLVCNLVEGVKNYHKRKYTDDVLFLSHQMSLASLKNCNHTISIELDDKVVVVA